MRSIIENHNTEYYRRHREDVRIIGDSGVIDRRAIGG